MPEQKDIEVGATIYVCQHCDVPFKEIEQGVMECPECGSAFSVNKIK